MADDLKRDFAMTYGELLQICDNVHSSMTRDIVSMGIFGVTPIKATAFKTQIDEFLAFPDDSSLVNEMMIATQNRNELANNLKILVRTFGVRAKIAFPNNQGKMDSFLLSDLSHASDSDLLFFCEKVAVKSVEYLTELAPLGLTQELIDELIAKTDEFRTARIAQEDSVQKRDESAHLRIEKANELYRSLINYTEIGKSVWYEVNEALYNDYVIYDSFSPGSLTAPTDLTVDVNTMTFSWSDVENATSFQLEYSLSGEEWILIYSGPDNFIQYTPETEGLKMYRTRCRNSGGYSEYSPVMYYNYISVLAQPGYVSVSIINANTGAIALNWEENPAASFFRLYQSKVGIGDPPSEYILVGEYTVGSYSGTVTTGFRYFFKVICGNSEKLSQASDSVFVDLYLIP